jgi:hypothetical protein
MWRSRRFLFASLGALSIGAVTTAAAMAAGLTGTAPGSYQLNDVNAFASYQFKNGASLSLTVEQGTFTYTPSGGTMTTTHATVLGVQTFSAGGGTTSCFVIPDSSLVMNSNRTLTLQATLTSSELVAQSPLPLEGDLNGTPQPQGAPFGPCFPAFGTLPLPQSVDTTWTPVKPLTSVNQSAVYSCGGFVEQYKFGNLAATASATTSFGGGNTDPTGDEKSEQFSSQVQGPGSVPSQCFGPIF